jgi:hypothetical protein
MGNNIVSMCGMDSILMWNLYGVWNQLLYPYYLGLIVIGYHISPYKGSIRVCFSLESV